MKKSILTLSLCCSMALAQTPPDSSRADSLRWDGVERYFEDQLDGSVSPEILEEMADRIDRPLNLNTAARNDLLKIPGMNPVIADLLLEKRSSRGRFRSFPQVAEAIEFDPQIMNSLRLFTSLGATQDGARISFRSRILDDLQPSYGFTSGSFRGGRPSVMNRATVSVGGGIEASFMTEKDAGESSLADFTSGYICVNDVGIVRSAVAGDFRVESGNGMSFAGSSFMGSGEGLVLSTLRSDHGVVPYRSTSEAGFFRGAGVNLASGPVSGFLFYSKKKIDATMNDSGSISSLYESGYHRTINEAEKRGAARESVAGVRVNCDVFRSVSVGGTLTSALIEPSIAPSGLFRPEGSCFSTLAIDYAAAFPLSGKRESVQISGEWLRSRNGAVGGTTGIIMRTREIQCEVGYRSYPVDLISLFGSGSSLHGSSMQNERGISMSLGVKLTRDIRLMTYYDLFEFPWRTEKNPLPTSGKDVQIDLEFDLSKEVVTRMRYDIETRQDIVESTRQKFRADVAASVRQGYKIQSRFEWIGAEGENGFLVYQNLQASPFAGVRVDGRIVYFSSRSYASALYEYEADMDGVFTTPPLFGTGFRWYLIAKYSLTENIKFGIKYAELRKRGVTSIGSGYDRIEGGVDNSLHFQADVSL